MGFWIATPPPWLEVCAVHGVPDESLLMLDPGERDAILLALERGVGVRWGSVQKDFKKRSSIL